MNEAGGLAAHRGRAAGTDAERRAAGHLRDRLEALGRPAELQTFAARPRIGLTHTLHVLLAIVGSVLAATSPAAGAAIVLFAFVSMLLDVTGTLHLVRRLTGRRMSQNVESRSGSAKPGTLVLCAHYDAPREAPAFALAARMLRAPWAVTLGAMLAVGICCALRVAGLEGTALTAVQFVPTVILILMAPAFADIGLSPAGAGVTRNAAGVAVALRLAEELDDRLEHFDVWVVLCGAQQPFAAGMRAWLRLRRDELGRESTVVLNVDGVGDGPLTYSRKEGPVLALRVHRQLVRLCAEVAEDGDHGARARALRESTDAGAALARGVPAVTVSSPGATLDPAALDRAFEFCRELAERVNAEVGPRLATEDAANSGAAVRQA